MADQLSDLLRERFAEHQADVPDGLWEAINTRLAPMQGEGALRETLQGKFRGHEVEVDASVWRHVSRQLGHGGATAARWWVAAGVGATAIALGLLFGTGGKESPVTTATDPTPIEHVVTPAPQVQNEAPATEPSVAAPATHEASAAKPEPAKATPAKPSPHKITPTETTGSIPDLKGEAPRVTPPQAARASENPVIAHPDREAHAGTGDAHPEPGPEPIVEHLPGTAMPEAEPLPGTPTPVRPSDPASATPSTEPLIGQARDDHATPPVMQAYIPDVFTPQGDGVNDELRIVATGYSRVEVRVVNTRTGVIVFHTNDLAIMWDGRLPNGNVAEEGQYLCVVALSDESGRTNFQSREVKLYR